MASYACTKCMQWFQFHELSKDKLLCSACTNKTSKNEPSAAKKRRVSLPTSKRTQCRYCQTDIKIKIKSENAVCERCEKNFKQHGEPQRCTICNLNSAFIGSKCQRCASSIKKYGEPTVCGKCNLKAAFNNPKAKMNGMLLCWLCYIITQRNLKKSRRSAASNGTAPMNDTPAKNEDPIYYEETVVYEETEQDGKKQGTSPCSKENVWKELFGEDHDYRKKGTNRKNAAATDNPASAAKSINNSSKQRTTLDDRIKNFHKKIAADKDTTAAAETAVVSAEDDSVSPIDDTDDVEMLDDLPILDDVKLEPTSLENSPRISSSLQGKLASSRNTPNSRRGTPTTRKLATPPLSRNDSQSHKHRDSSSSRNGTPNPRIGSSMFTDRVRSSLALDTSANSVIRPQVHDGNIVIVSELKGEISQLKKTIAKKDVELIEKDKQASMLKVEHIREVRTLQAKFKTSEEDYLKSIDGLRKKNQELLRKVAQLSKGKL